MDEALMFAFVAKTCFSFHKTIFIKNALWISGKTKRLYVSLALE
jgi:hypothetical protein